MHSLGINKLKKNTNDKEYEKGEAVRKALRIILLIPFHVTLNII